MIKEIKADFLEEVGNPDNTDQGYYDAGICTINTTLKTNRELVMGAGIAKIFRDQFPHLPKIWGYRLDKDHHIAGFMISKIHTICWPEYQVAFPTKNDWRKPSSLQLILQSTRSLRFAIKSMGWSAILLPKPGCQNGGLSWEDVKPIIYNELKNTNCEVNIISKD